MADGVPAGRGVAVVAGAGAVVGAFALTLSVSGPFCPHAVSSKPMMINAAIAKGV